MRARLALGMAAMLALWLSGVPLRADDRPAPPYAYSTTLSYDARIGTALPDDQNARATAAANAAEADCAAGGMAGCTTLGEAFMRGEGRPLNRPVAELILRKACNGAEARGCYLLAELLPGAFGNARAPSEAFEIAARACLLGSSDGCKLQAKTMEVGNFVGFGPADAMALRREACARGLAAVCVELGEKLTGPKAAPSERAEGRVLLDRLCAEGTVDACRALAWTLLRDAQDEGDAPRAAALFDRLCRARDAQSCVSAAGMVRDSAGESDPRFAEYQGLGCIAGDQLVCLFAAHAAARSEAGRAVAIDFYERACPSFQQACARAADLRAAPAVTAACEGGDQRACLRLGRWMAEERGPFADPRRALQLLSAACEAGENAACLPAGTLLIAQRGNDDAGAAARADTYLTRACTNGEAEACFTLAEALASGRGVAQDLPRALILFADRCEAGDSQACKFVAMREQEDPAVPLMLATALDPPTITEEERAAAQLAAFQAQTEAMRQSSCTTTRVVWEGREYADEACLNIAYSIGGFTVNRVELAPFQALLWRPAKLGTQTVGFREACGGSVVATGWIITAAHCTFDQGYRIEDHDYRIRLGVIQPAAPEGNSYPIVQVIRHPDFSPTTYQFDIALVQYDPKRGTRGDFAFGARRIAVDRRTLAQRPVRPTPPVFAFGWGRQSLDDPTPAKILQGVKLELEDTATCTERTAYRDWRKDSVLCAMGANREQACTGDSGGPLVTYEDQRGVPTLIGVVSSGDKCSTTGVPSRYIRIGHPRVQQFLEDYLPGFKLAAPASRAR